MPEVLGQEAAIARLSRMQASGKVPSALLFWGPEGVGKRLAAHGFAASLGCGPHDVLLGDFAFQAALRDEPVEKQQTLRVETVREMTRRASLRSATDAWKVFIIDGAEDLVPAASNALLKELEEPESRTAWILLTSRRDRILPTVLSRCQSVRFQPLPEAVLERLAEAEGVGPAEIRRWLPAADGSLTRLKRLARFGALVDAGRDGPGGYWSVSQGLPRDLIQARAMAEGILDALTSEAGVSGRTRELLKLRRYLWQNASPQMIVQLALLENERV